MENNEKHMELMKKLRTLAERGGPGERENARRMLDKLLKKYNVAEADLSDDVLEIHWYTVKNEEERKLLDQVAYKVAPKNTTYCRRYGKGKYTTRGIKCTKAQALQIEIEFDFYKALWQEEKAFFLQAFIQKHQIFDMSPGHATDDGSMSDDELFRMSAMINGMQNRTLHPMIADK